jgi:hypothetical protein
MHYLFYLVLSLSTVTFGQATTFDHPSKDKWNTMGKSTHLACVSHRKPTKKAQSYINKGYIVAHKTIPCYVEIIVCNPRTNICVNAMVADWGPVHASIDLYAPLSKKLQHNGNEKVFWVITNSQLTYSPSVM